MSRELSFTLTAIPENASPAREYIRAYIDELSLDEETIANVLTSTGEAIINAIEHAYHNQPRGPFHVLSRVTGNTLAFFITDEGTWKQPVVSDERGRGIFLMKALSEGCVINPVPSILGTSVYLTFPLIVKRTNALRKTQDD